MELIKAALTELGYPDTETVFASPKPINVHEYIVERLKEKWFFFSEGAYWYQQDRLHRSGTVLNNNGAVIIHITSPDSDMLYYSIWSILSEVNMSYILLSTLSRTMLEVITCG